MSRVPTGSHRTRSPSSDEDDDPDFLAALKLSKELNGELSPPPSAGPSQAGYDPEADFAYALALQFGDDPDVSPPAKVNAHASTYVSPRGGDKPQSAMSPWSLDKQAAKITDYHQENHNDKTFDTLAKFFEYVRSAKCFACGQVFFTSELDVIALLNNWKTGTQELTSFIKCAKCSVSSCLTCTPRPSAQWSVFSVQGKQLSWCCVGGRLFLLWLLLCGLDAHFSATKLEESTSKKTQRAQPPKKKQASQRGRDRGVGFGGDYGEDFMSHLMSGHGPDWKNIEHLKSDLSAYLPSRIAPRDTNDSWKAKALRVQQVEDQFYGLYLQLVEGLLPSFERKTNFDFDPPNALMEMLVESKILQYSAELLRNDSLQDATNRKDLYQALISLLRTLGSHYATASGAICNDRPLREDKVNLLVLSFSEIPEVPKEYACSLLDSLGNLNTQSELVLKGAKRKETEFRTDDGQSLLSLCRQISDLRGYLIANSGTKGKDKAVEAKEGIPALIDMPDAEVMATHAYSSRAKSQKAHAPGRFKRIITEITTLKTSLPPGIFIRYAESRPDVLKAVIIGPAGTPYENGVFEFDIFCDGDFPNQPPRVQFKTTGGGTIYFNPNLYADGKVCLSLLGTWEGEPWTSESTLLQVVISIQAMILCEEPWYNEPGREATYRPGSKNVRSTSYNQKIRRDTIGVAMLAWLNQPQSLWKDVLEHHFTANADRVLHTAVEWSKSEVQGGREVGLEYGSPSGFMSQFTAFGHGPTRRSAAPPLNDWTSLLQRLQAALRKYGASQVVSEIPKPIKQELLTGHPTHHLNHSFVHGTVMSTFSNPLPSPSSKSKALPPSPLSSKSKPPPSPPSTGQPQLHAPLPVHPGPWLPGFDTFMDEDGALAVGDPANLPAYMYDFALRGRGGPSFPSSTRGRGGARGNTSSSPFGNNFTTRGNVLGPIRGGFTTGRGRGIGQAPSPYLPPPSHSGGDAAGPGYRGGRGGPPGRGIDRGRGRGVSQAPTSHLPLPPLGGPPAGRGDRGGRGGRGNRGSRGGRGGNALLF